MIKDKHNIISELEIIIESYGHEYQSIGNEIKIYLNKSEVIIVLSKRINIYEHHDEKPYSYTNLSDAIKKLRTIIS